ncbi:hypothetical protein C8R44DRAFT_752693 [Mycena epipterygia]|nr:hypothetical protein C8R44DRAFT_752693 [Mycena epipterygia]
MAPDDWHVIEATTNFGEAQHKANNAQTGIGMGLVELFIQHAIRVYFPPSASHSLLVFRYEILDTRRAAEIETMIQSGNLHNSRNEVCHRYENRNAHRVHATEKTKQVRVEGEELRAAEEAVAAAQAHLKQIRAKTNVWCLVLSLFASGLLTPCSPILPGVFVLLDRGRISRPNPM